MTSPTILVTADVKSLDDYLWHATPSTYLEALQSAANAIPLILPSLETPLDIDAILDRVDGILATGSRSNVQPEHYGQSATDANGPYDPQRDATTLPLLRRAVERGIPVFAICRGMQELNVALGGTLLTEVQEMENRFDHRAPVADTQDERFRLAHPVRIESGGCLAGIVGPQDVKVNSLHRQALGDLGEGIVIEARAHDGTIEAVSAPEAAGFVLATQWHPEYWATTDTPSRKIFEAFGDAARAYASKKAQAPAR